MADRAPHADTRPSLLMRIRDAADVESWSAFVAVYAPLVYRHCRRRGLQDADAADVTQEVLSEVARCVRRFEYRRERGRFRDWLGTLTRRRLGKFFHRRGSGPATVDGEAGEAALADCAGPDPEWDADFNGQVLRAALERARPHFEPATWQAFEEVWLRRRPAGEVADALGLPIEKVYTAKSRVLKRLEEEVRLLAEDLPPFVPLG